jgi:hypothetical protein
MTKRGRTIAELRTQKMVDRIQGELPKTGGKKKSRRPPFTQIPFHWLPVLQRMKALGALPLLMAIAYQMQRGKAVTPITPETWALAGDPRTEAQKRQMIDVLRRAPSIVRLEYRQRTGAKYAARKGLWWDVAPPQVGDVREVG